MSLAIGGRPFGPYQLLLTPVSVYVQLVPSETLSGPGVEFAEPIAAISDATSPVVPEHAAGSVTADATPGTDTSASATTAPSTTRTRPPT